MYFKIITDLRKQKNIALKKLPGFTLIELSIALIIVGIIMTAAFKGTELLESARLQACMSDLNRYHLSIISYHNQYGQWPGNDIGAKNRFGNVTENGDGNGLILKGEQSLVWQHLYFSKLIDSPQVPSARIGGSISVISNPTDELHGNFLILSKTAGTLAPLLTPHQAMILKSKAGEKRADSGTFIVLPGEGVASDSCLKNGEFNLSHKNPSCVIALGF